MLLELNQVLSFMHDLVVCRLCGPLWAEWDSLVKSKLGHELSAPYLGERLFKNSCWF